MNVRGGYQRRRHWEWTPGTVVGIVLGNLAMVVFIAAFRFVDVPGAQWGLVGLGVVGMLVVWMTWHNKKDHSVGEGGKLRMHGAVDRLGYWSSVLITTATLIFGFFAVPMTMLS